MVRYGKTVSKVFAVIAAIAALVCALMLLASEKHGASGETLKSDGDAFVLSETEFGKDESFVYTATVRFASGKAAGLVFGASENEHYYVFNVDRDANRVKLLYFAANGEDLTATELITDYFIGNDKMTAGEKALVEPKVKNIDKVQLKVVISAEADGVYAEFYADNIRRFGVDNVIKLDELEKLPDGVTYEGGKLGYNSFASEVTFDDVYASTSDYSYYTELYRQQYHFSQYAHWNNDPNGLVYYDGWYHLYYQHHPFSNYWSDMYWGHARSRDLMHWELLPICLFPDRYGEGDGFMWSGTAMVYRKGMSEAIDALNWYENGNGTGLIAYYTRDGGKQDQMIMSSDDGGITWTKRKLIPQSLATGEHNGVDGNYVKTDCRDPKVFPVKQEGGKTTLWGMALTGMATYDVWFLKSTDMLNWSSAGGFKINGAKAECPDVVTLTADDGSVHTVMTFTGRNYMVGELDYDETAGEIVFKVNGADVNDADSMPLVKMDYGPDSYATQTYYIDDAESDYYGKTVSLSWFSGIPGDAASIESGLLAGARKTWNGGGMTIPVEWGLKKVSDGYVLTQTPIVKSIATGKTELYKGTDVSVNADSENILSEVNSHIIEIDATIANPDGAPVAFRINMNGDEYTEIGWNETDGYYVDRTHTGNAGLSMNNYAVKYASKLGTAGEQTFYILSDNGGVEVFCDDFSVPFYVLTFASPYAVGAEFTADGVVTANITVNKIASVWNEGGSAETILYVDAEAVELDKTLTPERAVMAYSTSGADIEWAVESGASVVTVEKTATGAKLKALGTGDAVIAVTSGNAAKRITVKVYDGDADSDLTFAQTGIVSGDWYVTGEGITGVQSAGDGFILSSERGGDFVYVARVGFTGAAAAVVFRATENMSDYLIANYDNNGKIVKLWSPRREIARASAEFDPSDLVFKITAKGASVKVEINNRTLIDTTLGDDEPTEGLFGLNVCGGRAVFKTVALVVSDYSYASGDLAVRGEIAQAVTGLYNVTLGNTVISPALYKVDGRKITLSEEYFATLDTARKYEYRAVGERITFGFTVDVTALPKPTFADITVEQGCNAVVNIGGAAVERVELNGAALAGDGYSIRNGMLTVYASVLAPGENTLAVPDLFEIVVTVNSAPTTTVRVAGGNGDGGNIGLILGITIPVAAVAIAGVAVLLVVLKKKKAPAKSKKAKTSAPDDELNEALSEEGDLNTEDNNGGDD